MFFLMTSKNKTECTMHLNDKKIFLYGFYLLIGDGISLFLIFVPGKKKYRKSTNIKKIC